MKANKLFLLLIMICGTVFVNAQSNGDKLFIEGQNLQKSMTVASQKAAIKKFQAAKVVYTVPDKKAMCDNQISICKNNISTLSKMKKKEAAEEKPVEQPVVEEQPVEEKKRTDVSLSLSETRLDFKHKPKRGATQSVEVNCNYDDWTIVSQPDWVEIYIGKGKFSVEASENKSDDDRSGVVLVKCEDKEVNLVINQDGVSAINKITGGFKGLFKKKKK